MHIRFLETFVWLTRLRNFRETADKLNTTQPNVNSRINSLENHLRTRLYIRGAKKFELTADGRTVLDFAEKIIAISEEMKASISGEGVADPIIQVGIIELVTLSWLPRFVELLEISDVPVEINLITDTTKNLVDMLRRSELDIAFIWGPVNEPNVNNEYICHYAVEWLGVPKFLPKAREIDVIDLTKLPVISHRKDSSGSLAVSEYFSTFGVRNPPGRDRRVSLSSYSMATAMELIRSGMGVMSMTPFALHKEIASGDVIVLPVVQRLAPCDLNAVYRGGEQDKVFELLIDLARQSARSYAETVSNEYFWF
jgi:DNA-binding transcriptional LysR family regulator